MLRAVAAYGVVVFHIAEFVRQYGLGTPRADIGRAGVDLFFVISGLVMVYVTVDHERPAAFWINRIARIVPLYWVATMGVLVFSQIVPWGFRNADLSFASVMASLLFLPHEDLQGRLQPVLFVGWTLNLEMMFYAVFGASLALPSVVRLFALFSVLIAGVLGAHFLGQGPISFYGNFIILEFVAGCVIGAVLKKDFWRQLPQALVIRLPIGVGLVGLLAAAFAPSAEAFRVIAYGVPASLLVFGVAARDIVKPPPRRPVLEALGNASYSAYLVHPFAVVACGAAASKLFGDSWIGAICMAAGTLIVTAAVSQVSFEVFEQRASKAVRLFLARLTRHSGLVETRRSPSKC